MDVRHAAATKRNLAAFLDQVHAFSPLDGELTVRSFLDYVDAVEDVDRSDDWAPVQPSDDDSVKVMTIHQAKGLEFDVVFVPGMARGLLPDVSVQQNPAERSKSLDFELRGDAEILPRFGRRVECRLAQALACQAGPATRACRVDPDPRFSRGARYGAAGSRDRAGDGESGLRPAGRADR